MKVTSAKIGAGSGNLIGPGSGDMEPDEEMPWEARLVLALTNTTEEDIAYAASLDQELDITPFRVAVNLPFGLGAPQPNKIGAGSGHLISPGNGDRWPDADDKDIKPGV